MSLQEKLRFLLVFKQISYKTIAKDSGVGYSSIKKVAAGITKGFNKENTEKIEEYLSQFDFPSSIG